MAGHDTLDLDRVKKSPLGRAWLSAFVRRVWDALVPEARERLWLARAEVAPLDGRSLRMFVAEPVGSIERATDSLLTAIGVLGEPVPVRDLKGFVGTGRWLTPLGVEIYLCGRREAGKRGGR